MGSPILFFVLAIVAIASALGMVLSRNAVHSALYLILNFATVAVLYIVLNAAFIAMVQVTVYAGAIMVLFLFVIMLLGAERLAGPTGGDRRARLERGTAIILGVVLVGVFVALLLGGDSGSATALPAVDASPAALGIVLFESYVLPFEITSILLLAAMIGVVVLSKIKKRGENA